MAATAMVEAVVRVQVGVVIVWWRRRLEVLVLLLLPWIP